MLFYILSDCMDTNIQINMTRKFGGIYARKLRGPSRFVWTQESLGIIIHGIFQFHRSKPRLPLHNIAPHLRSLIRDQRWNDLSTLITDEVLDTLVPQATYDELPNVARSWFGDLVTGILVAAPPDDSNDHLLSKAIQELRSR